jgi:putative transposase
VTDTGLPPSGPDVAATFRSPSRSGHWHRKQNRLPEDRYVGANSYFVTLRTAGGSHCFSDSVTANTCIKKLSQTALIEGFHLLSYAFMPDHVHLLVQGEDGSSLSAFIKRFKQSTGYWYRRSTGESLWQKSYYDHVLRDEEDYEAVALYIAANPVRAGLVVDWDVYPYSGGSLLSRGVPGDGDLKVAATLGVREVAVCR